MSCKRLFLVDYNFKKFADTEEADGCILNGGWVSTQIIFLRAGITLLIFVRTTTGIFFFFFLLGGILLSFGIFPSSPPPSKHQVHRWPCQTLPLLSMLMLLGKFVVPCSYWGTPLRCVTRHHMTRSRRVNGLPPAQISFFFPPSNVPGSCACFTYNCQDSLKLSISGKKGFNSHNFWVASNTLALLCAGVYVLLDEPVHLLKWPTINMADSGLNPP